jgi:phage baseplate assembly protein W
MAISTTTAKPIRAFKGGSSPITQRIETQPAVSPTAFNIITPLQFPNTVGETFKTTTSIVDGVIDDFKNLLLTNYGERLGRPDYGANLNSLLSERLSQEDWSTRASNLIRKATETYMSFISIESIAINTLAQRNDGFSRVQITIVYSILALGVQNRRLDLTLTNLS